MLLSIVIYAPGAIATNWDELSAMSPWQILGGSMKRSWFQTLMHIAVTSLWIMPVIRASAGVRIVYALFSAATHLLLSAWFNFAWVHANPAGIDGGPFGFLTWSIPAIVGTLACDAFAHASGLPQLRQLVWHACWLMVVGWGLSWGTRLYDEPPARPRNPATPKLAASAVFPRRDQWSGRSLGSLMAEPPFVAPPPPEQRAWNYWMMSQRAGTISYLTFASGVSLAVFALFSLVCDRGGWRLGVFQTFGMNALAAYIVHDLVNNAVTPFVPKDSPGWYVGVALLIDFGITLLFIRTLEKNNIYLRL
jgi:hypothetical protein